MWRVIWVSSVYSNTDIQHIISLFHDWCYRTIFEPLDNLILLNLCQHYFEATATAHHFACSSSVGWSDSNDWLHVQQSWLLRLHFVFTLQNDLWSQTRHQGIWSSCQSSACEGILRVTVYWHHLTVCIFFMCTYKRGEIWYFHGASASATC